MNQREMTYDDDWFDLKWLYIYIDNIQLKQKGSNRNKIVDGYLLILVDEHMTIYDYLGFI